jgi:hypothetical protein
MMMMMTNQILNQLTHSQTQIMIEGSVKENKLYNAKLIYI